LDRAAKVVVYTGKEERIMRAALPLVALALATSAAADAPDTALPQPELRGLPQGLDRSPQLALNDRRVCRDRIEAVRAASGLPALDSKNATDEKPLFIAAVDKRIGGCSVMVMRNNLSDIRPLPEPPTGPVRLRKIQ
jgi:hypothetical protein